MSRQPRLSEIGTWYSVVMTFDGSNSDTVRLYVDGSLSEDTASGIGDLVQSSVNIANDERLSVGGRYSGLQIVEWRFKPTYVIGMWFCLPVMPLHIMITT